MSGKDVDYDLALRRLCTEIGLTIKWQGKKRLEFPKYREFEMSIRSGDLLSVVHESDIQEAEQEASRMFLLNLREAIERALTPPESTLQRETHDQNVSRKFMMTVRSPPAHSSAVEFERLFGAKRHADSE